MEALSHLKDPTNNNHPPGGMRQGDHSVQRTDATRPYLSQHTPLGRLDFQQQSSPFTPMSTSPPVQSHPPERAPEEATVITQVPENLIRKEVQRDRMYLLVIAGAFTGQMFHFDGQRANIGRSSNCDIVLRDNDISRVHVELEVLPDGDVLMVDKGSTNGTFVNGRKVSQAIIVDGDRIQLGLSTILKFSLHDELEEQLQRRLYQNAILDGLTQLHNRKYFDEQLATEFSFAKRHQSALSILLMDVDHFKSVNDTYGHPVGDVVLQQVAMSLQNVIRKEDLVARYGGEEFVILTRGIMPTQAAILGERIRSSIEALSIPVSGYPPLKITISIGCVTMHKQQFDTPETLLQESDDRLYMAKRNGRNQVVAER